MVGSGTMPEGMPEPMSKAKVEGSRYWTAVVLVCLFLVGPGWPKELANVGGDFEQR